MAHRGASGWAADGGDCGGWAGIFRAARVGRLVIRKSVAKTLAFTGGAARRTT
jgi:hypothetical protein